MTKLKSKWQRVMILKWMKNKFKINKTLWQTDKQVINKRAINIWIHYLWNLSKLKY